MYSRFPPWTSSMVAYSMYFVASYSLGSCPDDLSVLGFKGSSFRFFSCGQLDSSLSSKYTETSSISHPVLLKIMLQ